MVSLGNRNSAWIVCRRAAFFPHGEQNAPVVRLFIGYIRAGTAWLSRYWQPSPPASRFSTKTV